MSTISPNMNLIISTVGVDSGLLWEQNLNASLLTIDNHNHTPGNGVQIPPSGLNINSALGFNNQQITNVNSILFAQQNSLSDLNAIFVGTDGNLYFNDGAGDPSIQITAAGTVNATSSGISSGTATASFVSSVLVVNSAPNTPANIQGGSILLGNNVVNSKFLTLQPPSAMAANFSLTLPSLPIATSFLTLDTSGNIVGSIPISQGITASNIANQTITQAQMANLSIGTPQLIDGSVTLAKLAPSIVPAITEWNSHSFTNSFITFTIASSTVNAGATYTNSGETFTVVNSIVTSTSLLCQCTSNVNPSASGTLTKTSGTGPATISFSAFVGSSNESLTVPSHVNLLFIEMYGGGGGAGGGGGDGSNGGSGAGGGGVIPQNYRLPVASGDVIAVIIGAGGLHGLHGGNGTSGNTGGSTIIKQNGVTKLTLVGATGGGGGTNGGPPNGGVPGSTGTFDQQWLPGGHGATFNTTGQTNGSNNMFSLGGTSTLAGGGGGAAGKTAGANGGAQTVVGGSATANSGAGGGGGGSSNGGGGNGANGGDGGSGGVNIYWLGAP